MYTYLLYTSGLALASRFLDLACVDWFCLAEFFVFSLKDRATSVNAVTRKES